MFGKQSCWSIFFLRANLGLTWGEGVRINLRGGRLTWSFKKFVGQKTLSKWIYFKKFLQGKQKNQGGLRQGRRWIPPPESSRVKNILYHLIFVRKAYIPNLRPLGHPVLTWDTCPVGWVGVGGQLRLYSLAQPAMLELLLSLAKLSHYTVQNNWTIIRNLIQHFWA